MPDQREKAVATSVAQIRSAKVTITKAQLLALKTNPQIIVPAPGAGKVSYPLAMFLTFKTGATGYVYEGGQGNLLISWQGNFGNDGGFPISTQYLNAGQAPSVTIPVQFLPTQSPVGIPNNLLPTALNTPLVLVTDGGDLTAGDGTLEIEVLYYIVTT